MRFRVCAAALALACIGSGLLGCGGGGSNSTTSKSLTGKYAGPFSGTVSGVADTGTLTFTVSSDGSVTGTAQDNVTNADATVTGTLSSVGAFAATLVYPSGTDTVSGMVSKTGAGRLIGTLTEFSGTTNIGAISIDLSPN